MKDTWDHHVDLQNAIINKYQKSQTHLNEPVYWSTPDDDYPEYIIHIILGNNITLQFATKPC